MNIYYRKMLHAEFYTKHNCQSSLKSICMLQVEKCRDEIKEKTINNIFNSVLSSFNCLFRIYLNRKTPLWVLNLIKIIHLFHCSFQILLQTDFRFTGSKSFVFYFIPSHPKQNAEIEVNQFTKCGDIAQRHFHIPKSAILIKSNITCWDDRTWPFLNKL